MTVLWKQDTSQGMFCCPEYGSVTSNLKRTPACRRRKGRTGNKKEAEDNEDLQADWLYDMLILPFPDFLL